MIIILTRKGNVFVNEKNCERIIYNRETKTVEIVTMIECKEHTEKISSVEYVRYVSDMHDENFDTETEYFDKLEKIREAWEDMRYTAYRVKNEIVIEKLDERKLEKITEILNDWCGKIMRWENIIKNSEKE